MREIKFRAWDKEDKKMFNIARFDFADNTVYSHLFACDGYVGESLEIMQFSGLKDKNGISIYEGDILIDRHEEETGEAVFENGSFFWETETFTQLLGEINDEIEVIGNVHE